MSEKPFIVRGSSVPTDTALRLFHVVCRSTGRKQSLGLAVMDPDVMNQVNEWIVQEAARKKRIKTAMAQR